MLLLGCSGGSASPPKRCLCSLFCFILPAIKQIRSDPVTSTRLRDILALDALLQDLPLLLGGSIYSWFPAHVASCFGGPDSTQMTCSALEGSTKEVLVRGHSQTLLRYRSCHQTDFFRSLFSPWGQSLWGQKPQALGLCHYTRSLGPAPLGPDTIHQIDDILVRTAT